MIPSSFPVLNPANRPGKLNASKLLSYNNLEAFSVVAGQDLNLRPSCYEPALSASLAR